MWVVCFNCFRWWWTRQAAGRLFTNTFCLPNRNHGTCHNLYHFYVMWSRAISRHYRWQHIARCKINDLKILVFVRREKKSFADGQRDKEYSHKSYVILNEIDDGDFWESNSWLLWLFEFMGCCNCIIMYAQPVEVITISCVVSRINLLRNNWESSPTVKEDYSFFFLPKIARRMPCPFQKIRKKFRRAIGHYLLSKCKAVYGASV